MLCLFRPEAQSSAKIKQCDNGGKCPCGNSGGNGQGGGKELPISLGYLVAEGRQIVAYSNHLRGAKLVQVVHKLRYVQSGY